MRFITNYRPKKFIVQSLGVQPGEIKATLIAFSIVFLLMASYFTLRPIRDSMASDWSDSEVSWLWNLQFFVSIGVVALYGVIVTRYQFRRVIPFTYGGFGVSFLGFYVVSGMIEDALLIDKSFYIWVSTFSLFHLSMFWSLMTEVFDKNQCKRLFAIIGSGASAGAIVGPLIPLFMAELLGLRALLLLAAAGMFAVIPLVLWLFRLKTSHAILPYHKRSQPNDFAIASGKSVPPTTSDTPTTSTQSGSSSQLEKLSDKWWSGFRTVLTNPMLLGVSSFILLYVFIGSFLYFEQKNILADYSRIERTEILAALDGLVNLLTFIMAFFVTGRIVTRLGMPFALALVPFLLCLGLVALAISPLPLVILGIQLCRRAGNYAITRPAREMLYSEVSRDERYKAKPVIDVVVYRGGDAVSGSLFALLTDGLGLGLAAVAVVGALIAATWTKVALFLGRQYEGRRHTADSKSTECVTC